MNLPLLVAQILLLVLGLVGVAAAEPTKALDHGLKALLCLGVTFGVARVRPQVFLKGGVWLWLGSLVLLVLVLFVGVGTEESTGTRRWLDFGPVRFQPSELAKLGLVLQLASFFARRGVYKKLLSATAMILVTTLLILLEPDLGTSVLTFALGIVVMYSAGVRITNIAALLLTLGLLSLPFISVYLERHPYIQERLFGHTEREQVLEQGLDQIGKAHRDLSNGGLWGLGPDAPRFDLGRVIILIRTGNLPFQGLWQFGFLRAGQFHHVALRGGGGDHAVGGDRGAGDLAPHQELDAALAFHSIEAEMPG